MIGRQWRPSCQPQLRGRAHCFGWLPLTRRSPRMPLVSFATKAPAGKRHDSQRAHERSLRARFARGLTEAIRQQQRSIRAMNRSDPPISPDGRYVEFLQLGALSPTDSGVRSRLSTRSARAGCRYQRERRWRACGPGPTTQVGGVCVSWPKRVRVYQGSQNLVHGIQQRDRRLPRGEVLSSESRRRSRTGRANLGGQQQRYRRHSFDAVHRLIRSELSSEHGIRCVRPSRRRVDATTSTRAGAISEIDGARGQRPRRVQRSGDYVALSSTRRIGGCAPRSRS